MPNPNFVDNFVPSGPYAGSTDQTQAQTVEKEDDSNDNDNDNDNEIDNNNDGLDDRERNDEIGEDLPQEGGCQEGDDFCDADEGCRSESVDCIDDREFDEDDYDG